MNCYIIVFEDKDPAAAEAQAQKIREVFGNDHHKLGTFAWAVGSTASMPHEVCEKVGIHTPDGEDNFTGVVGRVDTYNGWFDTTLWEKMRGWKNRDEQ